MKKLIISLTILLHVFAHQNITIIGTGYVGLVTGAGLAELGNNVICADIDIRKIQMLEGGEIPIYEPGLKELVDKNASEGKLVFTNNVAEAIQSADVVFIAVGTPMANNGSADLSAIFSVAKTIGQNLNKYKVICTKSTVPVGTGMLIEAIIKKEAGHTDFDVVSNPEFLREGNAVFDFLNPDRIVLGCESEQALDIMKDVYESLLVTDAALISTNRVTSETIKYASNAFLAVKLSFINEMAQLCDVTNADVKDVARGMGLDKRIGKLFLNPGPGFGGSCFPKDSAALLYTAKLFDIDLKLVRSSLEVNELQKKMVCERVSHLLDHDLNGKTVAVLGLAFKADTDDVRCSPSIEVIEYLKHYGAFVKAFDPVANENMKKEIPDITYSLSLEEAVMDVDAVVIMTEWNEFKSLDLDGIKNKMKSPVLVDTRNILDHEELRKKGFRFDILGRSYLSRKK